MDDLLIALKAVLTKMGSALLRRVAFYCSVVALLLTASGFGLAAGWTALAETFDGMKASLIIAGGGLESGVDLALVVATQAVFQTEKSWLQAQPAPFLQWSLPGQAADTLLGDR